jgi:YVTN family beta-propeller protein
MIKKTLKNNVLAVVDPTEGKLIKTVPGGQRIRNRVFSPDRQHLYTTHGISNDIPIIGLKSQAVTPSAGVGTYPWGVAVKP